MVILFYYPNEKSHWRMEQARNYLFWGQFIILQDLCYLKYIWKYKISQRKEHTNKKTLWPEDAEQKLYWEFWLKISEVKN